MNDMFSNTLNLVAEEEVMVGRVHDYNLYVSELKTDGNLKWDILLSLFKGVMMKCICKGNDYMYFQGYNLMKCICTDSNTA